jgi:hypothetical protein
MRFRPGQQVVCVHKGHAAWQSKFGAMPGPKYNEVCTVHGYRGIDTTSVWLKEYLFVSIQTGSGYNEKFFEPLPEISEVYEVLEKEPFEV